MKNQLLLFFLLLVLLLSCDKEKLTKTLDFKEFRIDVPSNWKNFTSQGYDSKVGGITNGEDELMYDYGLYAYDLNNEKVATYIRTTTTIDGKPALIVQPKNKGTGLIGVFIQVNSQTRFVLYGSNIRNEDTVIKIFKSVKF